jgi:hypothetical protein
MRTPALLFNSPPMPFRGEISSLYSEKFKVQSSKLRARGVMDFS